MKYILLRMIRALIGAGTMLLAAACVSHFNDSLDDFNVPAYGVPPPKEHPTVKLVDFTYEPASPILAGDKLTFTAQTNEPVQRASIYIDTLPAPYLDFILADDGRPPDETESDGTWTAELEWDEELGPVEDLEIRAILDFYAAHLSQTMSAPPLTVLPEDE